MKIFAIADLHLSFDENINKPMNKFGPGWEDHPDRLKENWEKLVTDEDIVMVPGDISWGLRIEEAIAEGIDLWRRGGEENKTAGEADAGGTGEADK